MTRIIAGAYGGRRLTAPARRGTRPTTDRVREALFSRLDHLGVLPDAEILDLYAGSGALGLEAVSRGARHAVMVELSGQAARATRRNISELGASAEVVTSDADRYLRRVADAQEAWVDIAFLDPPYDVGEDELAGTLSLLTPLLREEAVVVVERSSRSPEPRWPSGLERFASKAHGETALWYAEAV